MRARGHGIGAFTLISSDVALNVRLYQVDAEEQFDHEGPMTAEYAWAEQEDDGQYVDVDDPGILRFDHRDVTKAVGEMAILAMNEIAERREPEGARW